MRQFDFYEFVGVLAPGAVVLYGVAILFPELGLVTRGEVISFGEFGLVVILAYVSGHIVQAVGNIIEWFGRKYLGEWPSDWVRTRKHDILSTAQWDALPAKIRELLHIDCPDILDKIPES